MALESHLMESDLVELFFDSAAASNPHLQKCPRCRDEFERLQRSFKALRADADAKLLRSDDFWCEQQRAIRHRLGSQPSPAAAPPRIAWATGLIVLAIAALLLIAKPAPVPPLQVQSAQSADDHEMLIEVERALQSDGPAALEPATLLAHEINQDSFRSTHAIPKKETKDEN
jgi:hypothetical protein